MKLIDIANKIDKSENNEDWVNICEIANELDINLEHIEQSRLKSYWVGNWCCTDSWVGYKIYFLDGEPVAFSIQEARRCDENIKWFSKETAVKVREYLISLMLKEEDYHYELCDINDDIGDSYKIDFNNNVIDWSKAMLNGESVEFIKRIRREDDWGIDREVEVKLNNGEIKIVNIKDLDFKFHLA